MSCVGCASRSAYSGALNATECVTECAGFSSSQRMTGSRMLNGALFLETGVRRNEHAHEGT